MRVPLLLISALALPGVLAFSADGNLTDRRYDPIRRYYDDCSYVAQNSSVQEIVRFVSMVQRSEKPQLGPLDVRTRRVWDAIAATHGVLLHIDPGIFALLSLSPLWTEYMYMTTPIAVVAADNDRVRIRVRRTSASALARPAQPAASGLPNRPPSVVPPPTQPRAGAVPFVTEQIDEWVLVGGTWRLKSLHYIEI